MVHLHSHRMFRRKEKMERHHPLGRFRLQRYPTCSPSFMCRRVVYALAAAGFPCCNLSTFFTIFCSSTRNARMMRSRTTLCDRVPPYARLTVLFFLDKRLLLYSVGLRWGIYVSMSSRGDGHVCVWIHCVSSTVFFVSLFRLASAFAPFRSSTTNVPRAERLPFGHIWVH